MSSEKTPVIEYLWEMLQTEGTGRTIVYSDDVVKAIQHCKQVLAIKLSTGNPANFMKDVVRADNASDFWPKSLTAKKIGGRQRTGNRRVLEFVLFAPGQTEPFPDRYTPGPNLQAIPLQSINLPLTSKSLGRKDESWLIQVAVNLRVIEQHLAVNSKLDVIEVSHLQNSVKLGKSEVDSLFLATLAKNDGKLAKALITCEAKQEGQRVLDHQIVDQIVAANRSIKNLDLGIELIVPIAMKAIPPSGRIYIAEFVAWTPAETEVKEEDLGELNLASEGLYELKPPVPGIGHSSPKKKRTKK
jgi:hypothetical protein